MDSERRRIGEMGMKFTFTENQLRFLLRDTILAYLDHVAVYRSGNQEACIEAAIRNEIEACVDVVNNGANFATEKTEAV